MLRDLRGSGPRFGNLSYGHEITALRFRELSLCKTGSEPNGVLKDE